MDLLKNKTLGSFLLSKVKWSRWQDSFKKQEFYETVHRTVFPKFVALCSRQIWIIPPQVRAFSILNNKKRDAKWKTSLFMVEVTGLEPAASCSQSRHSSQTELHLVVFSTLWHFNILFVICQVLFCFFWKNF